MLTLFRELVLLCVQSYFVLLPYGLQIIFFVRQPKHQKKRLALYSLTAVFRGSVIHMSQIFFDKLKFFLYMAMKMGFSIHISMLSYSFNYYFLNWCQLL